MREFSFDSNENAGDRQIGCVASEANANVNETLKLKCGAYECV